MHNLHELKLACIQEASEQFAYNGEYDPSISPLHNHCGPVSYTVRNILGGSIMKGKVNGVPHMWNRLDGGIEVDLTSDQFGGDGYLPVEEAKGREAEPTQRVNPRFNVFYIRVLTKHYAHQASQLDFDLVRFWDKQLEEGEI